MLFKHSTLTTNTTDLPTESSVDSGRIRRLWLISVMRFVMAVLMTVILGLRYQTDAKLTDVDALLIGAAYSLTALAGLYLLKIRTLPWRGVLLSQLMLDIVLIGLLVAHLGGSDGGYAILYLMPMLVGATFLSRSLALFICAIGIIGLILDALRRMFFLGQTVDWFLLALYGLGSFLIVLMLRLIAERVERQETLLRQARTTSMLIQEFKDQHLTEDTLGWLIISQSNPNFRLTLGTYSVEVFNSVARNLAWQMNVLLEIGLLIQTDSPLMPWLRALQYNDEIMIDWPISGVIERVYVKASNVPQMPTLRALTLERAVHRHTKQQTQQLAVMGRIAASIAHEIRNPLAAISQSLELLQEAFEIDNNINNNIYKENQALLTMMLNNTARIDRIVRNLLTWSRGINANVTRLNPNFHIDALLKQLSFDLNIPDGRVVFQPLIFKEDKSLKDTIDDHHFTPLSYEDYEIACDADHLYQIISNLLGNALRYANTEPASIQVVLRHRGPKHLAICILDNGTHIDSKVAAHLFEPFQTTFKQGTGLGLFLCREYALANKGVLELFENAIDYNDIINIKINSNSNTINTHTLIHQPIPWFEPPYTKAFVLSLPWFNKENKL